MIPEIMETSTGLVLENESEKRPHLKDFKEEIDKVYLFT